MAYASNADVEERLGTSVCVQLTDDAGTGLVDGDKVTEARIGSEGEVDSYLGRRCAVPVDLEAHPELAAVLKSVTLDLVEYRLHARRQPVPQDVRLKRDAALQWLQRVASGQAVLPAATEPKGNPATGIAGTVIGARRVLTRDQMENL